jgi:hypothetical protein
MTTFVLSIFGIQRQLSDGAITKCFSKNPLDPVGDLTEPVDWIYPSFVQNHRTDLEYSRQDTLQAGY